MNQKFTHSLFLNILVTALLITTYSANAGITSAPSVSITSITKKDASPTKASTVSYTVVFSDPISGVSISNFSLATTGSITGVSISSLSGAGSVYTVTVNTGSGDGSLTLNLNNSNNLSTGISNSLPFIGETYIIDKTAPTVTISSPSVSICNSYTTVDYTITWDDANLKSIQLSPIQVYMNLIATGTADIFSITINNPINNTIKVSFELTGNGTISFKVPAGSATDYAGNLSAVSSAAIPVIVDNTPPTVTIGSPSMSGTGELTYTVNYSDANFNTSTLSASDIILNTSGTATGTQNVTGSGSDYLVTISNISGLGSLGISVKAGTASDLAGNFAKSAGPSTPYILTVTPVSWLSFDVKKNGNLYQWNWKLATEKNVAAYIPQYSKDGISFTDAGQVTILNENRSYQFSKELSLSGKTFFRIKEIDIDGRISYSVIRALEAAPINFSFYPNPVTSVVNLQLPFTDADYVTTVIINNAGEVMRRQTNKNSSLIKIDVTGLAQGTYFIYCIDNKNRRTATQTLLKVNK